MFDLPRGFNVGRIETMICEVSSPDGAVAIGVATALFVCFCCSYYTTRQCRNAIEMAHDLAGEVRKVVRHFV